MTRSEIYQTAIKNVIAHYAPCNLTTSEIIEELVELGYQRKWASFYLHSAIRHRQLKRFWLDRRAHVIGGQ
jgi:hypothetical protein